MTPRPEEEWSDAAVRDFWGKKGWELPRPDTVVVVAALVVTVALVALLGHLAFAHERHMAVWGLDVGGVRTRIGVVLGGVGAAGLGALCWTLRHRDVRFAPRLAVALVAVYVALAGGAAYLSRYLEPTAEETPTIPVQPATLVTVGACILLIVAAALDNRRRGAAPRWLYGAVVFALAFLAVLGVWLPIVLPREGAGFASDPRAFAVNLAPRVLAVPAVLALAAALIATLWPAWMRAMGKAIVGALAIALGAAVVRRIDATGTALVLYAGFGHMLIAAVAFALVSIAVLAWSQARALRAHRIDLTRPAPWVQRGIVETPPGGGDVGHWIIDGWLAGMRGVVRGFTLRTARGAILHVPDGARLVVPVPASSADAEAGTQIPVVTRGAEVLVSGFVGAGGDGPFRSADVPIPGTRGLVVSLPPRRGHAIDRDVLLVLYRPCMLFLVIAAIVALPFLARP